jgi:hypothetical protein
VARSDSTPGSVGVALLAVPEVSGYRLVLIDRETTVPFRP